MTVRIVVGPPCAGKSTYCAENAEPGDVIVDYDKLASALGSSVAHAADGAVRDAAFAARDAAIDTLLKSGDPGWIIHTSPQLSSVAKYRAVGAEFIVIDPGIDVCLERAAERPEGTAGVIRDWYESPPVLEISEPTKGAKMLVKSQPVKFKTGDEHGLTEGQFIVYPSTFTREPDSYGDIVAKGAFADTLAAWAASGKQLPGLFGHRMDDPDYFVAGALEMGEDDHGWWVKGEFDMDSPKGPQVYRLVKSGRISELSFAFDVLDEGQVELEDGRKANELRKLDVFEFSFVTIGANRDTSVFAVKSAVEALAAGIGSGQALTAKHHGIIEGAIAALDASAVALKNLLAQDESAEGGQAVPGGGGAGSDEEPVRAKSGDLDTPAPGVDDWALQVTMSSLELAANI